MKNYLKTYLKQINILILVIVTLQACVPKPLTIKVPQKESSVVVYSQIVPNQVMFVALTRSFGALDFGDEDSMSRDFLNTILLDSALVTISYQNKTDTLTKLESGIYASVNTLQIPNVVYTLKAIDYTKNQTVTSSAVMLEKASFSKITPEVIKNNKDTSIKISYEFNDLAGSNWYMINIYNKESIANGLDVDSYFDNGQNSLRNTYLLTDYDAENGLIKKEIEIAGQLLRSMDLSTTDTIAVTLSNISYDYYNYIVQRKKAGNLLSQLTSEPISYPTNVNNGYGFFNTHYPDAKIFDLNKF